MDTRDKGAEMDEQTAFDAIEREAETYIERGYEPTDSEPGEWLELTNPSGAKITVRATERGVVVETS
jgi:hypothetical protein